MDPSDAPSLQRELSFEPSTALFATDQGLALSTAILLQARARNAKAVVLEIGAGQFLALRARAEEMGWAKVSVRPEWGEHERILIAEC